MLLGTRKTLYDHILEALLEKPMLAAEIETLLRSKKIKVTVQGIYKALRELIAEDIITKKEKTYIVSSVWRKKLEDLVSQRIPFQLSTGEESTYRFKKLNHLDAFWKHTIADLEHEILPFPIFHFTPHQFWFYVPGRQESEQEYYKELRERRINVYTIIGDTKPLDKISQKFLRSEYHELHLDNGTGINRRDHMTIMGPYIITTRISGKLAQQVDWVYQETESETVLKEKLVDLFKDPGSIILNIEHNQPKAKKLRKRLARDFVVPRELVEKFDLF